MRYSTTFFNTANEETPTGFTHNNEQQRTSWFPCIIISMYIRFSRLHKQAEIDLRVIGTCSFHLRSSSKFDIELIVNTMYSLLPQFSSQPSHISINSSEVTPSANGPSELLCEAVFAGDNFLSLEASFGSVVGVIRTATGYCGGTLKKPTYREVCEGRTGHTEAVKVIYDKSKISFRSLCDLFWDTHDPTNRNYLNFGLSTHQRSAIYYSNEEERKQAQESKIRRQMKLNRRIVTKMLPFHSEFHMAENQHQKYYLQRFCWLCESLSLRSTDQFVESNVACKLNGILSMDEKSIIDKLTLFLTTNELPKQTKLACEEIIEDLRRSNNEHKRSGLSSCQD